MVSVLAFYSVDLSSIPAKVHSFKSVNCLKRKKIIKKMPWLAHLKKLISLFNFQVLTIQLSENVAIKVAAADASTTEFVSFHSSGCVCRTDVVDDVVASVIVSSSRRSVTRRHFTKRGLGKSYIHSGKLLLFLYFIRKFCQPLANFINILLS